MYCPHCLSSNLKWIKTSGKGKVYTYSTIHEYPPPLVARFLPPPYNLAIIELEEGLKMLSNIVDCKPEDIACDMKVEVVFHDVGEGVVLPWFKPVG